MTETRFKIPIDVWERAVDEIHDLLVDVARRLDTITHADLARRVTAVTLQPDSNAFHHMLRDVSERAHADAGLLLGALVVSKDYHRPNPGFFDLARRLGFDVERTRDAEDLFWAEQVDALQRWWGDR